MQRRPFGPLSLELKACFPETVMALGLWRFGCANGKSTGSKGPSGAGIFIQVKGAGFPCEMLVGLAERMTSFNPDQSWQAVTDIEPLR